MLRTLSSNSRPLMRHTGRHRVRSTFQGQFENLTATWLWMKTNAGCKGTTHARALGMEFNGKADLPGNSLALVFQASPGSTARIGTAQTKQKEARGPMRWISPSTWNGYGIDHGRFPGFRLAKQYPAAHCFWRYPPIPRDACPRCRFLLY